MLYSILIGISNDSKMEQGINKAYMICFTLACVLVMGLRNINVGVDTWNYSHIFNSVVKHATERDIEYGGIPILVVEIGYAYFMKTCALICNNYFFFQLVYSIVFCGLMGNFIYKNSNDIILSTIVFLGLGLYLAAFNIQRQCLAIAILANMWQYLKVNKIIIPIILVAISSLIHTTSLLGLLIIAAYYLSKNKCMTWIMVSLMVLGIAFFDIFIELFFDSELANARYSNYLDNHKTVQTAGGAMVVWGIITLSSIWLILKDKDHNYKFIALMSLLFIFFNVVGLKFNYLERIGLITSPYVLLLFPIVIQKIQNYKLRFYTKIATGICFLIWFSISLGGQYEYDSFI